MNQVEGRAYDFLQKTTKRTGACWETDLLWLGAEGTLPESYQMALGRLPHTERKLAKDPLLLAAYKAKFDEYLEKGYIRKLDSIEVTKGSERMWYISHFGVTNPNKTGKLRLVFDAAARSNGVSLNEALSKGPDLIRPLTSVLWNFRVHNIALTGDITDMFHRVRVIKEEQCSHRFLWRNMNTSIEPDHYEMQVLIFMATSSPCSAIHVKNENAMLHELVNHELAHTIVNDFYIDDCLTGADSEENCMDLRRELSEVNAAGGFHLCKFNSNSRAVIESIPEELRAKGVKSLNEKSIIPAGNVLGMLWDPTKDIFGFKFGLNKVPQEILEGAVPTKCQACSLVMSVYDPLGFVNHFKIKGIIILQRTWIAGIRWDEELTPDIYAAWKLWLIKLKEIHLVQVPRCAIQTCSEEVSFDKWSSPIEEAYHTKFGAARLGTRFAVLLRSELRLPKVDREVFWSDSKTVLAWIRSEAGRYKEFVANRVGEIQEAAKGTDWRWVPTSEIPADIVTRFMKQRFDLNLRTCGTLGQNSLKDQKWPKEAKGKDLGNILATRMLKLGDDSRVSPSSDVECRRKSGKLIRKISQRLLPERKFETFADIERCVMVVWKAAKLWRDKTQRKRPRHHRPLTRLLNLEDFSSLNRLVCRAAAVQKAARFWYKKTFHKSGELNPPWKAAMENNKVRQHSFTVSPEEYRSAVTTLLQWVQTESFPKEIAELTKGRIVKKAKIARLFPCLINGTICLKSRILQANKVPAEQKTPAILPSDHHVTGLLIQAEHERCAHHGSETLLNNLRGRFLIIDGRQTVLRTIRKCPRCRLSRASPVIPEMGQLPHYRLAAYQRPFTFTGLDAFGPFTVTVGRRHEKRWVIIFTCLVTRAIHLEVVHALSTDEFMMGLSQFIDTRGRPDTIYSDNRTNFNIINSRPLTYVSSNPTEEDSLTPNHFLRGANDAGPSIPKLIEANNRHLREQWKIAQQLTNEFWIKWTRDYIPKLMTRSKWHHQTEPIRTGDLVFLVDELHPRNMWKRGFVSDVHFGLDGQVRVATITTKQNGKAVIYKRLVTKICHLGLRMELGKRRGRFMKTSSMNQGAGM
ncbi:hypothetical protein LAZ67_3002467 [Cordylochernes scorpioides]|uniref:DUF5641 domain-containing protein n=1 Tax=Cordylochernes scorpioides TaxID=51811 RepID=A0ABY6K8S7_9ARAC|nr:hypothetical protein LAZ67_3002467 [Cordylochernes scorpioides]